MFAIKLYRFDKKVNSTKRPSINAGVVFQCSMKTPSSIYSPVIDIKINNNDVPTYNYAYIEKFNRYYFITNTIYNMGVWTISLAVDLLASFKNDIFNSRQYVVRSSSDYNPYIIDTLYMTYRDDGTDQFWESEPISQVTRYNTQTDQWESVNPFNVSIDSGYFIVSVVGQTNTGVTYYVMNSSAFNDFLQQAFTTVPSNMTDVDTGTASALYNSIQYITGCRWFPISPSSTMGTSVSNFYVGSLRIYLTGGNTALKINGTAIDRFSMSVDLPTHPQYTNETKYLNYAPYTELGLYFQPFGTIPIDTTKVTGSDRLRIYWYVDYCSGVTTLEIRNNATSNLMLIYTATAEYGVPIPVSTMTYDWKGALAMGTANWIKTQVEQYVTGANIEPVSTSERKSAGQTAPDIVEKRPDTSYGLKTYNTLDLLNAAINIAGATLGQLCTVGAQGSFLAYNMDTPYLYAWFSKICDTDPDRFGYPLNEVKRIDQLTGFCQCLNATVTYTDNTPLAVEMRDIETMLNTGIFIE